MSEGKFTCTDPDHSGCPACTEQRRKSRSAHGVQFWLTCFAVYLAISIIPRTFAEIGTERFHELRHLSGYLTGFFVCWIFHKVKLL